MIHTLYKSICIPSSKFYIGVHSTNDVGFGTDTWKDPYIGSGNGIRNGLKKYGRKAFVVEIIAYFDTVDFAYDAEGDIVTQEWIDENRSKIYNIIPGGKKPPKNRMFGDDNPAKRPEVGEKIRQSKLGKPSPCGMRGKHHTEETKKKLGKIDRVKCSISGCDKIIKRNGSKYCSNKCRYISRQKDPITGRFLGNVVHYKFG
jgi:hypothetical protein